MFRRTVVLLTVLLVALGSMVWCADSKVTINALFMKQAGYSEEDVTNGTREFEKLNPQIKVELTFVPYEALEQKIITSSQSGGYDVVLSDGPFTAKFAQAKIVRELPKLSAADLKDIFPGAIEGGMYNGKFYGMPWLNDCKYLFYNKKILKSAGFSAPPKTWDELMTQAKVIKDKGLAEYPIAWSWSQAECLICDFTTLTCAFGGGMYDKKGQPQFTAAANQKALDFMVKSIKDGISNPKSTEWVEDDVRAVFSAGSAAFCLNWTFVYNAAKDPAQSKIVDDVGIAVIPGSGGIVSATVNGGQPLSISPAPSTPMRLGRISSTCHPKPSRGSTARTHCRSGSRFSTMPKSSPPARKWWRQPRYSIITSSAVPRYRTTRNSRPSYRSGYSRLCWARRAAPKFYRMPRPRPSN